MTSDHQLEELKQLLEGTGQDHLLQYWDELNEEQRKNFHTHVKEVLRSKNYIQFLNEVLKVSKDLLENGLQGVVVEAPSREQNIFTLNESLESNESKLGLQAVRNGQTSVVVLAGGSGTRLGATFPKGMLVCPQLSLGQSLFEMHCRRVRKVELLAGANPGSIQLSFMTSSQTHVETSKFLKDNQYFGLQESQVSFFLQSSLPCFTEDGKFLLQEKDQLATAPGGNGGIWAGLSDGGILDRFEEKGVKYTQILTVDNLIAKMADPAFYGFAIAKGADVSVKSTPKAHDHERVGVFAKRDGRWGVVEYTEVGKDRAEMKDDTTGKRLFDCANIAIHLCTMEFMKKAAEIMKTFQQYHAARKAIPTNIMANMEESVMKRSGLKVEAFIFDVFQFSDNFCIVEVDRGSEFAPVKNADNPDSTITEKDSPASAVGLLHCLHHQWLAQAVPKELYEMLDPSRLRVEISPTQSYQGEGLSSVDLVSALTQTAELQKSSRGHVVLVVDSKGKCTIIPFEAKL